MTDFSFEAGHTGNTGHTDLSSLIANRRVTGDASASGSARLLRMQVAALWRYPVKSMLGERVDGITVTERGLVGDRAYALIDEETGKVVSAKNPRRWAALLACRAEYVTTPKGGDDVPVRITLPDGSVVLSDDPDVDGILSRLLDRSVHLATKAPDGAVLENYTLEEDAVSDSTVAMLAPGTFFDLAPLHVLTNATLARFAELEPHPVFDVRRFRPNIVVDTDETGFVENAWVGHTVTLGSLQAQVVVPAPRCIMTTLAQDDLTRDNAILQAAAKHNRLDVPIVGPSPCVGVYAMVTAGGTVAVGDPVTVG